MEFNLFKASKFPFIFCVCHMIDAVFNVVSNDCLEHLLFNNDSATKDENPEVAMCVQYLEASPQVSHSQAKVEILKVEEELSSNEEQAPKV